MAKINPFKNNDIDKMITKLEIASNVFATNPALDDAVRQVNITNSKLTKGPSALRLQQTAAGITQQFTNIFSGNELMTNSFLDAFSFQNKLLHNTNNYYLTDAVASFRNNLFHNNIFSAVQELESVFTAPTIEAPNLALLKLNKPLIELSQFELPKGMQTAINSLHINTAKDLSISSNVSYRASDSNFFIKTEPESHCTVKEANVIYSVTRLFDELTDEDLFSFLRHLSSYYSLGAAHPIGKKILKIVAGIKTVTSFDEEFYYHARALDDDACPFTDEDMTCAPHGITSFGRFNHIGKNYFYFSNQQSGAIEEIRKHTPKSRVQVAKLRTKGKVQMIDISEDKENVFLKYCRFPFDPNSNKKVPREYLIPSFFSDCCKVNGFDGIKYYGTKDYYNYVTWIDGHFVFDDHEIFQF